MKKILLLMFILLISSSFVYAGNGMDSESFIYQGSNIHLDLIYATSEYLSSINITYPNGTDKVFIPLASIVGLKGYVFSGLNTKQIGNYYFHCRSKNNELYQSATYVDIISESILRSAINFVPSGMSFGIINKTFRHDWIISNPFDSVVLSSPSCKIYDSNNEAFITNAGIVDIYDNKRVSAETNMSSVYFTSGKNYYSNCTITVTYGSVSAVINHMVQYIYATKESQIKSELDSVFLVARQQYNKTISMFGILNSTYLNTRRLINITTQINATSNQILLNTTKLLNITRTNQNLLNSIWTKVQSIWNWVSRNNQTLSKLNQTIVSNNTFMIEQLRKDHISTIS